ncbi:MAG: hypothetical protein M3014_15570 [Chloroflexota bacterium]|nr:hypothetical protein [Chloroflexota bacterium]
MAKVLIIHVVGEDPILGEVEDLPKPGDNYLEFTNPRKRDGKPVAYVTTGAKSFMYPWHRISFVEVMTTETERQEVIEFFREDH